MRDLPVDSGSLNMELSIGRPLIVSVLRVKGTMRKLLINSGNLNMEYSISGKFCRLIISHLGYRISTRFVDSFLSMLLLQERTKFIIVVHLCFFNEKLKI